MNPETELNIRVAEDVMGWVRTESAPWWHLPGDTEVESVEPWENWSPSTDIRAAWHVRNRVNMMLFSRRKKFVEALRETVSKRLDVHGGLLSFESLILHVQPVDICKAALETVG